MNIIWRVLLILIISLLFLGTFSIFSRNTNGDDVENPTSYFGCYKYMKHTLEISDKYIIIKNYNQRTAVNRILHLKNAVAIETVNNIEYMKSRDKLLIGEGNSGFFYKFDGENPPISLLVPSDEGEIVNFRQINCL